MLAGDSGNVQSVQKEELERWGPRISPLWLWLKLQRWMCSRRELRGEPGKVPPCCSREWGGEGRGVGGREREGEVSEKSVQCKGHRGQEVESLKEGRDEARGLGQQARGIAHGVKGRAVVADGLRAQEGSRVKSAVRVQRRGRRCEV